MRPTLALSILVLGACVDLTGPRLLSANAPTETTPPERPAPLDGPRADAAPDVSPEPDMVLEPRDGTGVEARDGAATESAPDSPGTGVEARDGAATESAAAESSPGDAPPDTSQAVLAGLVGYWKLDEAAGGRAADSSPLGNLGAHSNGPTPSSLAAPVLFPNPGSLGFLQAQNQGVVVPDSRSLSLTGPFTLAAWVRPTLMTTVQQGIIEKWEGAAAANGYFLRLENDGRAKGHIKDAAGNYDQVFSTTFVPPNGWTHLALVYDGSALRMYVGGVQENSVTTRYRPTDGSTTMKIGQGGGGANGFNGQIDDARVYDRALAPAELMMLARGR